MVFFLNQSCSVFMVKEICTMPKELLDKFQTKIQRYVNIQYLQTIGINFLDNDNVY